MTDKEITDTIDNMGVTYGSSFYSNIRQEDARRLIFEIDLLKIKLVKKYGMRVVKYWE